jgi:hypothetical protein
MAEVHSANIQDREGIKLLLQPAKSGLPRLSHVWMDASSLHRPRQGRWVGGGNARVDGRDRQAPAQAGSGGGDDEVG